MNLLFRLTFSLLFVWLLCSCENSEKVNTVSISGQIMNPKGDSVFIRSFIKQDEIFHASSIIDESGNFTMSFELDKPGEFSFYDKNESSPIFLFPGDELTINVDTKEFDESIKYTGSSSAENNFLAKFYLNFNDWDTGNAIDFYSKSTELSKPAYIEFVKIEMKVRSQFLEEAIIATNFSEGFIEFFKNKLFLDDLQQQLYVFYGRQDEVDSPEEKELKMSLVKEVIEAKTKVNQQLSNSDYRNLVLNNIPMATGELIRLENPEIERDTYDSMFYLNLSETLSQGELNVYLNDDMSYILKSYNVKYYESKKTVLDKYLSDTEMRNSLAAKYESIIADLEKGYAQGLNKEDFGSEENKEKTLNDILAKYKGKVIYLDIWASWCGPCKAELPYSKKLKQKFEGDDVVFIYLSTDKKLKDWENMLVLMQLEGEHYRASKEIHKYLSTEYDLQYIPHYILFDKEGKLVKNNAPRPSSEEIAGELEALL